MEKIVKKLIDESICDADSYFHNGNILVIYTEKKEWVFELKKNGDLWYNYYFFKDLFSYLSMDVVENQHYITKYVEDALQNGVKNTIYFFLPDSFPVEDALQNGVKNTKIDTNPIPVFVEDALQNGVKNTLTDFEETNLVVEDALQNGVKNTATLPFLFYNPVEDALQNGVKNTSRIRIRGGSSIEDALQNGLVNKFMGLFGTNRQKV